MTNPALSDALEDLACLFGEPLFADHLAGRFCCPEADVIARILLADGRRDAAHVWLTAHIERDGPGVDHTTAEVDAHLDQLAADQAAMNP